MASLLKPEQLEGKLEELPRDWTVVTGNSLVKAFIFDNFSSGVGFVVKVGELADSADHHPDVRLSWGKVEITLSTHEESGLTQKDFDLAKSIESIKL